MGVSVGGIRGDLFLETATFIRDMKKAGETVATNSAKMRQSMKTVERAAANVQKSFATLKAGAAALAGALAIRQFTAWGQAALDSADSIAKTADMLGLSTDTLQQYQVAAGLSGIQTENFSRSLRTFVSYLGQARTGTGSLYTQIKKTDEAFLNQILSTKTTDEALNLVITRMGGVANAADRAALAYAAFGGRGVTLVNLLRQGAEGLAEMRKQAIDMGIVLEQGLIRQAEAVNDRMSLLKQAFTVGFSRSIILQFASAFQLTADNINSVREAGENAGRIIGLVLAGMASAAQFVGRYIREITSALTALIALKAAGFFIEAATAITKFAIALKEAAKAGAVSNLISGGLLKNILKIAAAIAVAAGTYALFEKQLKSVTGLIDQEVQITGAAGKIYNEANDKLKKYIETEKQHFLANNNILLSLRQGREAYDAARREADILNEAQRKGIDLTSKLGKEWENAARANALLNNEIDKNAEKLKTAENRSKEFSRTISSTFADAIVDGKNFGDVLAGLAQDIERMIIQLTIEKAIRESFKAIGGGAGSWLSFLGLAKGGAFASGKLLPFASGGVVSKPTVFPFAGGTGLMGEAGPEAIMPLSRGPGGRLGVQAVQPTSDSGWNGKPVIPSRLEVVTYAKINKDGELQSFVESVSAHVAGQTVQYAAPSIAQQGAAIAGAALGDGKFDKSMGKRYQIDPQAPAR